MKNSGKILTIYILFVFAILLLLLTSEELWRLKVADWVGAILIGGLIFANGIVGIKTKSVLFKRFPGDSYYGEKKWGLFANTIVIILGLVISIWGLYLWVFNK